MKTALKCSCLLAGLFTTATALAGNTAAYIRGESAPWGETTNEEAMDDVFGPGGWDDLRMADGAGPFSAGYTFIFLEGGDNTAIELANFLDANRAAIEDYVAAGGNLLLNSAPNEGGDIDFGFDGVMLINVDKSKSGASSRKKDAKGGGGGGCGLVFVQPGHPILSGSFQPSGEDYTGDSFCHAIVEGGDLLPVILTTDPIPDELALGEKGFGVGCVLLGGMTTDNFHDPQPNAANLRRNIIEYTANGSCALATGIPTLSWQGGLLFVLLLSAAGVGVLYWRRVNSA